jgi:gliding motility-associated-like protein
MNFNFADIIKRFKVLRLVFLLVLFVNNLLIIKVNAQIANFPGSGNSAQGFNPGFVEIPNFPNQQMPFSLLTWIKVPQAPPSGTFYPIFSSSQGASGTGYRGFWLQINPAAGNSAVLVISFGNGAGCFTASCRRSFRIPIPQHYINTWIHVAAVVSSPTQAQLYINGVTSTLVIDGNANISSIAYPPASQTNIARIGAYAQPQLDRFNGEIDEMSIWSTALTAAQVREFMCKKIPPTTPGLIAYYKFDEPNATVPVQDASTPAYNGTTMGGPMTRPLSGAFIGDESDYSYNASATSPLLHTNSSGDSILAAPFSTNIQGIQMYTVNTRPNHINGFGGDTACLANRYHGYYVARSSGAASNVSIEAHTSPASVSVRRRLDNAATNWLAVTPVPGPGLTFNFTGVGSEFMFNMGITDYNSGLPDSLLMCKYPDTLFVTPPDSLVGAGTWDDNSTDTNRVITQPGTYVWSGYYLCAGDSLFFSDTVVVHDSELQVVDTTLFICQGYSVNLGSMTYTNPGVYADTVFTPIGCDTVFQVTVDLIPDRSSDTTLFKCPGDSVEFMGVWYPTQGVFGEVVPDSVLCDLYITVNIVDLPYEERDTLFSICEGDTVRIFGQSFFDEDTYEIILPNPNGCPFRWTIEVVHSAQLVDLNLLVELCPGDSFVRNNRVFYSPGIYTYTVDATIGCDTLVILEIIGVEDAVLELVAPRNPFCPNTGGVIRAEGPPPSSLIQWSTGERGRQIQVFEEGWVWAEYSDRCAPQRDSIYMYMEDCGPRIFVPNAFAPTGNNRNERFVIQGSGIRTFEMRVFNRWGQQIFHTTDINNSWDGTFNGELVQMSSYVYIITYTGFDSNRTYEERGNINVIR